MTKYRERKAAGMYAKPEAPGPDDKYDVEDEPSLASMSKEELLDLAKERGVSPANATMTKAELRAALEG